MSDHVPSPHVIAALHAVRGADFALTDYAEHGFGHDLDAATNAARRLVSALDAERKRLEAGMVHA